MASEVRDLVRRAAGDTAGKTVAAQVRQAARHLGFSADDWRPRELWYGRSASAAALDDLRKRFQAWREGEQSHASPNSSALARRVSAIRQGLVELARQVDELAAEIAMTVDEAQR